MLTREDALNFLQKTLHIEKAEEKLNADKLSFLNEIIVAQCQYVPYQNFHLLATESEKRCNPTHEECIRLNLNQTGGVCVTLQAFFLVLLQCLGYKAHVCSGYVPLCSIPDNHVVIIVSDVQESGDKYYVDVGFSYPTLTAIPLHHLEEGESDIYNFCFLTMRIRKEGEFYVRSHKKTEADGNEDENWMKFLSFEPDIPKDFSYFDASMKLIFCDESSSPFLYNIFASRYLPNMAITVKNWTVKIWHAEDKTREQLDFDSVDKAAEKISELFPMIDLDVIRNGYISWQEYAKEDPQKVQED